MKKTIISMFIFTLLIAIFLAPLASSNPDGFDRVAIDFNFADKSEGANVIAAPLSEYSIPSVGSEKISTALAGIVGALLVMALSLIIGKTLRTKEV